MRPNSIRTRMTIGFALYIAALMLLGCTALARNTRRVAERRAQELLNAAIVITEHEVAENQRYEQEHLRTGLPQRERKRSLLQITQAEQVEIASGGLSLLVVDGQQRVLWQSQDRGPRWPQQDGDDWRIRTLRSDGQTLVLALPWEKTEHGLREQLLALLGLSVLIVTASALGGWFLVGRTLAPIDHLARQARAASTESLRVRLNTPSPDIEIVHLVTTLNSLLERLGETAAARGRFYAAASHELRTPLQALTGHLEVALSRWRNAVDYEAALREAHAQAERLTSLVQDLLLLNQLDVDTSRPPGEMLDLADICETELSHLRLIVTERNLKIQCSLPDVCEITAPWNHVTMLVRNLLENAVKYAIPGSEVNITLDGPQEHVGTLPNGKLLNGVAHLAIWNQCELIEGWEATKYFEPFFRPDASRNSQTGGNGLGLAICKAICDTQGWTIALQQEDGGMCAGVMFSAP
jgi:signal transduction histidine kinase